MASLLVKAQTFLHQAPIAPDIGNKVVQVHISSNICLYSTVIEQPRNLSIARRSDICDIDYIFMYR